MIAALSHRGPDSEGAFEAQIHGHNVFLGHTRLSILDLSEAGRQPMSAINEDVTVVYNGEIYNYLELKQRYLRAFSFRSRTDTEVLLNLYCALGPGFVTELNGDFAFAILDERIGRLYLYRDRLGVKPLYYYDAHNTLAFSSEIKSLLAAGLPTTLSEESIQRYFVFKYVPGNDTLYREVKRVPPGCYLDCDLRSGRFEIQRYWSAPEEASTQTSERDLRAELRELLRDAVERRLIADVPIGNLFSGGLDSSIIASFLRDHPQITHYCARKTEKDLRKEGTTSDYDHAQRLANEWGLHLEAIDIDSADATPERVRQTIFYSDDLIADGSQIPSILITEKASKTSKVMLSGMGADELFYGYAGHQLILLSQYLDLLPASVSHVLARAMNLLSQGKGSFKAYRRYLHKLGKYYSLPSYKYGAFSIVGDLENSLQVCSLGRDSIIEYIQDYFPADRDPFASVTKFELDNFLVKNLHYLDRMCMANSIEGRVPFMDHCIVEFAIGLQRSYKLTGTGRAKKLLKDTFSDVLPEYIVKRRKAGFGMPLRSIFSNGEKIDQLLDLEFFAGFGLFDVDHIKSVGQSHVQGDEDNSSIIYALISFQEWYQIFNAASANELVPTPTIDSEAAA